MARKMKKGSAGRVGALRRANAMDEAKYTRRKMRKNRK